MENLSLKLGDKVFHISNPKQIGLIKEIKLSKINNYLEPLVAIEYPNITAWCSASSNLLRKVVNEPTN